MPRPRIEIEPPPAWFSLADMVEAYMSEHTDVDTIEDAIAAVIWGEGEDEDENQ